jgi:hypothetical protein
VYRKRLFAKDKNIVTWTRCYNIALQYLQMQENCAAGMLNIEAVLFGADLPAF